MTSKSDFTPAEWELLRRAPVSVALAMATVDETGSVGFVREMLAGYEAASEQSLAHDESTFFLELSTAFSDDEAQSSIIEEGRAIEDQPIDLSETRATAITEAKDAMAVLAAKATTDEADAYRKLLLDVAESVMERSKSGGLLGIGGQRVTPEETGFYEELKTAIGGS